jgi:translation initiation factor IF-1
VSDGKLTAWIGVARFRITQKTRTPREKRMVEILPGDVVLRNAKRLYCKKGFVVARNKGAHRDQ